MTIREQEIDIPANCQGATTMTDLQALITIAQTLLRVRGEWTANPMLRKDIRDVVADVWIMMRIGDDTIIADAIFELERRARGHDINSMIDELARELSHYEDICGDCGGGAGEHAEDCPIAKT